ncbi:MAG TPA: S41 family peptidase [Puia sp.]|nr:S41 family peptidase [Puia sp.]
MLYLIPVIVLLEFTIAVKVRAQSQMPVSTAGKFESKERNAVIDTLVKKVNDYYVFPEVAQKMADVIRQRQKHHDYDTVTSREVFAKMLTVDLQAISKDGHLGVDYSAAPVTDEDPGAPPEEVVNQFKKTWALSNFNFKKVEHLDGNVGLLQLDSFFPADWIKDLAAGSMQFLANSDAIIIDLRRNHGFAPDGVLLMESYFFNDAVHLTDNHNRDASTVNQVWTMPTVPGPKLPKVDLYILVSKDCFSASEDFTYNLQSQGRAKVIGEVTGGGAHGTKPYKIGTYFTASIPFAYEVNTVTHTDWEGKGVQPDVKVPADQALLTAQIMAIRTQIKRFAADTERVAKLQKIAEQKQKELDALKPKIN